MPSIGIPDEEFVGGAPMTKQEVRAVTLSKARIGSSDIVYDIGSGCGSIAVEAALLAANGRVYAIEKEKARAAIIRKNLVKFGLKNVEVVEGEAPAVLSDLPSADRIIIGGTGGKMNGVVQKAASQLRRGGLMVINCVAIESLGEAISSLQELGLRFNVAQVSISRGEQVNGRRIMRALNPVYVLDARR